MKRCGAFNCQSITRLIDSFINPNIPPPIVYSQLTLRLHPYARRVYKSHHTHTHAHSEDGGSKERAVTRLTATHNNAKNKAQRIYKKQGKIVERHNSQNNRDTATSSRTYLKRQRLTSLQKLYGVCFFVFCLLLLYSWFGLQE